MSKLTEEQIDKAARAASYTVSNLGYPARLATASEEEQKYMAHEAMIAAAPYLQFPWDEPTRKEIDSMLGFIPNDRLVDAFIKFVDFRNAALLPQLVDPRRDDMRSAILRAYEPYNFSPDNVLMDRILDELLAVKSAPPCQKTEYAQGEARPKPDYSFGYARLKDVPTREPLQPNQADWQKP